MLLGLEYLAFGPYITPSVYLNGDGMMAGGKKSTKDNEAAVDPANKWEKLAEQAVQDEAQADEEKEPVEDLSLVPREALEADLNALQLKMGELKDSATRARAELENVRRRAERDVENAHKFGVERLLESLLPVMDSLTRGLEGADLKDPGQQALAEGMNLTIEMFEKNLQKFGLTVIDPAKGETFNPDQQQAMSMQPDPEAESNTILQVLQKGYLLHGRTLRAAMVIVAQ